MKPIQYQNGYVEFYKLKLAINPNVLIPRPETELIVDEVLHYIKQNPNQNITVWDIGTGSGNIAIAIASNSTTQLSQGSLKILASDISPAALDVTKRNAKFHAVQDSIIFVTGHLLNSLPKQQLLNTHLVIVANLPYIPTKRIPTLDPSVKDFEPHLALDGGEDGFELYRELFVEIKKEGLKPDLIMGEIDYLQGRIALAEIQKYFSEAKCTILQDLTGLDRFFVVTV